MTDTRFVCSDCGSESDSDAEPCRSCQREATRWRDINGKLDDVEAFIRTEMEPIHSDMVRDTFAQARLTNDSMGGAE